MSIDEFSEHCKSPIIGGYGLRQGQRHPTTYDELIDFIGDRLELDGPPFSVSALAQWVLAKNKAPYTDLLYCQDMDVENASAVLLIGDLPDADGYVARLPADYEGVMLPPSAIVAEIVRSS